MTPGDEGAAFTRDGLDGLFRSLQDAPGILVAVSGGPDSVALLHLFARWRSERGRPALFAATVDHGLRPDSAAEATMVAAQAAHLGIPHRTLAWTGPKPRTGLQEAARVARYRLLCGHAREVGATHLATAHTCDDQAETVLMRMARGSGVAGLAGMRPETDRDGIRHVRPLLAIAKDALVALCRREGLSFVEDPANADDRFTRARWRKLLPELAAEGLTAKRLGQLARRAQRVEDALAAKAREALSEARSGPRVQAARLGAEPFEIAVRMLACLLEQDGEDAEPLRLQRLEAAVTRLRSALDDKRSLRLSLAGRLIDLDGEGYLTISPEPLRRRGRYPYCSEDDAGDPGSLGKGRRHA